MKTKLLMICLIFGHSLLYAQLTPEISLRVNDRTSTTIQPGFPVIVSFSILTQQPPEYETMIRGIPDSLLNDPGFMSHLDSIIEMPVIIPDTIAEWHNRIFFVFETEGQRRRFRFDKVLIKPYPPVLFINDPGVLNVAYFGIDPEITEKWRAGIVRIKAGYVSIDNSDTLWSGTSTITIKGEVLKDPADLSESRLRFIANYLIRRDRCDRAMVFAEELLRRDSSKYLNTSIMAKVKECNNEIREALNYYITSLRQFDEQAEPDTCPPVILYRKINELQLQLLKYDE